MAFEDLGKTIGEFQSAADLSGNQYRAVSIDGSGEIALAAADGIADGILQNDPIIDRACTVMVGTGITKAVADAAIALGAELEVGTSGRLRTAAGAGSVKMAKALQAAGAQGEVIPVLWGFRGTV